MALQAQEDQPERGRHSTLSGQTADLGVLVRYLAASATVPFSGSAHEDVDTTTNYTITGGNSITIAVDAKTGDVTISR